MARRASVEAQVRPVRREDVRVALDRVVQAERRAAAAQDVQHLVAEPLGVAQLHGPAVASRRGGEEGVEPLRLRVPVRRQLHENGPEPSPEPLRHLEEARDGLLGIAQPLHVGSEAAELEREAEARRDGVAPARHGLGLREPVEGGVHLEGIEVSRVEVEPARLRERGRVEAAPPVVVLVARGSDPEPSPAPRHQPAPSAATAPVRVPRDPTLPSCTCPLPAEATSLRGGRGAIKAASATESGLQGRPASGASDRRGRPRNRGTRRR